MTTYQRKIRKKHGKRSTPRPGKRWIISKKDAVKFGSPEYEELKERLIKTFDGKEGGGYLILHGLAESTRTPVHYDFGTQIYCDRNLLTPKL